MQAAQYSGYRAQLPTIAPGFDLLWGCNCMVWKNTECNEQENNLHEAVFFFASKPCITVRVGAAMLA